MKKRALHILFLLFAVTHSFAADQNTSGVAKTADFQKKAESNIQITTRPEILGLWGMEIPNNKKCTEYYNFRSANEVVVNSAKEWSVGLFEYQPSLEGVNGLLPTLVMQIKYENNEKDCSGNTVDQSGELSQYFIKWQNPNLINFCATEKGDQCFATLRRILP